MLCPVHVNLVKIQFNLPYRLAYCENFLIFIQFFDWIEFVRMKREERGKTAILMITYVNLYEFKFKFNFFYEKLHTVIFTIDMIKLNDQIHNI